MKRILLLLVPALLLGGCNSSSATSGGYKKCNFFNDGNTTYVTNDGSVITYYDVATYAFSDSDYATLQSALAPGVSMPKEIAVIYNRGSITPINGVIPGRRAPSTVGLDISGFLTTYINLNLKKNSEASYETYTEVYFNETSRTAKLTIHQNVKTVDSKQTYTQAYEMYYGSNVNTKGEDGKITEYTIVNNLLNLNERTLERYITFTDSSSYMYSFSE